MVERKISIIGNQSRSASRERSQSGNRSTNIYTARTSKSNLRRDDPQIKARLDNLVKSASMYKTKACGVLRPNFSQNNNNSSILSSIVSHSNNQSISSVNNNRSNVSGGSYYNEQNQKKNCRNLSNSRSRSANKRQSITSANRVVVIEKPILQNKNQYNSKNQQIESRRNSSSNSFINNRKMSISSEINMNRRSNQVLSSIQRNNRNNHELSIYNHTDQLNTLEQSQYSNDQNRQNLMNQSSKTQNKLSPNVFQQHNFSHTPSSNNSHIYNESQVSQTTSKSIKPFCEDAEFIEFLKNISLYVTSDETPRSQNEMHGSQLYDNLQYLRDKFKEYKFQKDTSREVSRYEHDVQEFSQTNNVHNQHYKDLTQSYTSSSILESERSLASQQKDRHLKQLPEKQRKQIEFIDDIYDKIVLKKSTHLTAKNINQSQPNVNHYDSETYKPMNIILKTQDSQLETSSFYSHSQNQNDRLIDKKVNTVQQAHPSVQQSQRNLSYNKNQNNYMFTPTPKSQNHQDYNISDQESSLSMSSQQIANQYQPSAQIEQTLKALTETAQQLKQACLGINQIATHLTTQQSSNSNLNSSSKSLHSSINDRVDTFMQQNSNRYDHISAFNQDYNQSNITTPRYQQLIQNDSYNYIPMPQQYQPQQMSNQNILDTSNSSNLTQSQLSTPQHNNVFAERFDNKYNQDTSSNKIYSNLQQSSTKFNKLSQPSQDKNQNYAQNTLQNKPQWNISNNSIANKRNQIGLLKKHQSRLIGSTGCQLLGNNMQALQKQSVLLAETQIRSFSVQEPTPDQVAEGKKEWGEKYQDEVFRFEQEWKKISDKVISESRTYISKELSDIQKKKVEMLADKILDFNIFEMRYFNEMARDRIQRTSGMSPFKLNVDWPSVKADETGMWPPANPNWFKQQEMLAQLGPAMSAMGMSFGAGGGAGAAQPAAAEAKVEAPKEEEKKEKSHYDIELSKFDPAKKITLIKEIRAILGLGLKEAKEMVEGAPVWIKKEVAKEEAEKLAEKLKELGAECRLA